MSDIYITSHDALNLIRDKSSWLHDIATMYPMHVTDSYQEGMEKPPSVPVCTIMNEGRIILLRDAFIEPHNNVYAMAFLMAGEALRLHWFLHPDNSNYEWQKPFFAASDLLIARKLDEHGFSSKPIKNLFINDVKCNKVDFDSMYEFFKDYFGVDKLKEAATINAEVEQ